MKHDLYQASLINIFLIYKHVIFIGSPDSDVYIVCVILMKLSDRQKPSQGSKIQASSRPRRPKNN